VPEVLEDGLLAPFSSNTVAVTRDVLKPSATIWSGWARIVTSTARTDGPSKAGISTSSRPHPPRPNTRASATAAYAECLRLLTLFMAAS
jgi:hypothetical protein